MTQNGFVVEEGTIFYGRTFEEYCRLFDLSAEELLERRVLDCPGGPSSFTAVAATLADDAVAVDPVYGPPVAELASACTETVEEVVDQLRDKPESFEWDFYGDVETRGRYARAAFTRFLADYARSPERYVEAGLPSLPFDTGAFDLVCSANLLFLYDDRLDRQFHQAGALELARVAQEELRLSGLQTLEAERSEFVGPVVDVLQAAGCSVECRTVPYRFQPGETEMLVATELSGVTGEGTETP